MYKSLKDAKAFIEYTTGWGGANPATGVGEGYLDALTTRKHLVALIKELEKKQEKEIYRELRFISFKNKMKELYYLDLQLFQCFADLNIYDEKIDYYGVGDRAGRIFRIREWFYDHFDWRF